jgi:hypothetical protein
LTVDLNLEVHRLIASAALAAGALDEAAFEVDYLISLGTQRGGCDLAHLGRGAHLLAALN